MRKTVLAAVVAAFPCAAGAQGLPTYDNAQIIQRGVQFGQTIHQWNQQRTGMQNQLNQLIGTYRSLTGGRPMDGVASLLRMAGIYLPGLQSGDIGEALRGYKHYAAAAQTAQRNLFAEPVGADQEAGEMGRRRTGLANRWEDALEAVRSAEQRLRAIGELRDRAGRTSDLQESAALQNRIAAEQAALSNDSDRTQRVFALQQTQDRINEMRDREMGRQASQDWFDATAGAWRVRW